MNPRVAVLAEGSYEAPLGAWRPEPGDALTEEHLGPAHVIVRRLVAALSRVPHGAVGFVQPLAFRGRLARGSDLRRHLRALLAYPPGASPTLVVAIVDEDGEGGLEARLRAQVPATAPPTAIAVPVREFEAWLLGDARAVRLATAAAPPTAPERLEPGAAKAWLVERERASASTRAQLAAGLDLDVVARACESFRGFRAAAPLIPYRTSSRVPSW
jgi:hypothetical protein